MNNDFSNQRIAFIGAGNMSRSIIGGLVNDGFTSTNIIAANPSQGKRNDLARDFSIDTTPDNLIAAEKADMIVLAVKPQMINTVCEQLAPLGEKLKHKLFVSVLAGTTCERIQQLLGQPVPIIRCMPNTPALYAQGASGLYSENASQSQRDFATFVMQSTGLVVWVKEQEQIDTVTAISGSGPAYFFMFMEAMVAKAEQMGFDPDTATKLVQQTAMGAATMAMNSDLDISQLRQNVTSKGGTTAAALNVFSQQQLPQTVATAMQAAKDRAEQLAKS